MHHHICVLMEQHVDLCECVCLCVCVTSSAFQHPIRISELEIENVW